MHQGEWLTSSDDVEARPSIHAEAQLAGEGSGLRRSHSQSLRSHSQQGGDSGDGQGASPVGQQGSSERRSHDRTERTEQESIYGTAYTTFEDSTTAPAPITSRDPDDDPSQQEQAAPRMRTTSHEDRQERTSI
jgi:hypothetical protein